MLRSFQLLLRMVRNQPGFYLVVLATLALGIGATTAVFSMFNAVLLKPFPFPDPDQLYRIRAVSSRTSGFNNEMSIADFKDLERSNPCFAALAQYTSFSNTIAGVGPAQSVKITFTTPGLFSMLGARPHIGRTFTTDEDRTGGNIHVAVLSHGLWQSRFGGDPNVLNTTVRLRGESYTIIGVMPKGFLYPDRTEVWVPLMARIAAYKDPYYQARDTRVYSVLARLRPALSISNTTQALNQFAQAMRTQFPDTNRDIEFSLTSLRDIESGTLRPYLIMLSSAVILLLGIACVNVANLMLTRATARQREFAIRSALGGSRGSLISQLLTESVSLSLLGAVFGLAGAWGFLNLLPRWIPVDLPFWLNFEMDWRVFLFAILAAGLTGIFFGLAPALEASNTDLADVMKQGAKGSSAGTAGIRMLRNGLVVSDIAISLTLLILAGLMLQSFLRLQSVDPGIRTTALLDIEALRFVPNLDAPGRDVAYAQTYRRITDQLRQIPGVISASNGGDLPIANHPEERRVDEIHIRGQAFDPARNHISVQGADVAPGYFSTLGIRLLEGRDFNEDDDSSKNLRVIVSERFARQFFGNASALGQQICWGKDNGKNPYHTIIGVVSGARFQVTEQRPGYEIYFSYRQYAPFPVHFLLHYNGSPLAIRDSARNIIHQTSPDMAITYMKTIEEHFATALWQRRLWSILLGVFALLALLLAAIGLYGVLSYLVAMRKREIGIRIALGSPVSRVLSLILADGMRLTGIGLLVGLLVSAFAARLLGTMLLEISAYDLATYGGVTLVLLATSFTATAIPAWRASRVDPIESLRKD